MNFRKLLLKSGNEALAGKNAETNEIIVKQAGKEEIVLHTSKPGSPFVNIKTESKNITKQDIKEAAIFCTAYSQAWKKTKKKPSKIEVDYFLGKDIFKLEDMKTGTFGVRKRKTIILNKEDIDSFFLEKKQNMFKK